MKESAIDVAALQRSAEEVGALLKVLANPARLMLLCTLSEGERCVGELEEEAGIHQPTLSQQLGVLREENMVSTRRVGKQIYYSIASPEALEVIKLLHRLYCSSGKKETGK